MAYDEKTFGMSPFDNAVTTPQTSPIQTSTSHSPTSQKSTSQKSTSQKSTSQKSTSQKTPAKDRHEYNNAATRTEALSDHVGEHQTTEASPEEEAPTLPAEYAAQAKPPGKTGALFYIPKGRVTGLNLLGEALGWLMAWGTVGFFRAYVPAPILLFFDTLFTPYGMASITLLSALLLGKMLKGYELKLASLKQLATAAIEYGETHHRADTQNHIYDLLSTAEANIAGASRWLVSWLTALGCLLIIGAFY